MASIRSAQRRGTLFALAMGVTVAAAGCSAAQSTPNGTATLGDVLGAPIRPSLTTALRDGRDVGPVAADRNLYLSVGLAGRDQAALTALVNAGGRVSPAEFARRFGPDPIAVAAVEQIFTRAGMQTSWQPGAMVLVAAGHAAAAERLFSVALHDHVGPDGTRFFAASTAPTVPQAMRPEVTAVTGFNNYPSGHVNAIRSANGVTPSDMIDFYNATPLRDAHIDGTGQTIVFIEGAEFQQSDLDAFASKFHLPPFHVEVHRNPAWGDPSTGAQNSGEPDLDLEVAHGIAPGAKLVVYYTSTNNWGWRLGEEQGIFHDFPSAIESVSWGDCETQMASDSIHLLATAAMAAAGTGLSQFVASGDRGAYDCVPDGDFNTIVGDGDAGLPAITSVGGTLAFLGQNGGYGAEAAWGEPAEQWGSSGGLSMFWNRPKWQIGPGVDNQYSNGKRQTPDVAANSDSLSGWETITGGSDTPVGGTSAAAPFWAAVAALIDQDLTQKHLPTIGFANPALYFFATNPAGLPAAPFHDVTTGTNLYYPATPGWDYATGLGSPNVAALADDFEWYMQTHPNPNG